MPCSTTREVISRPLLRVDFGFIGDCLFGSIGPRDDLENQVFVLGDRQTDDFPHHGQVILPDNHSLVRPVADVPVARLAVGEQAREISEERGPCPADAFGDSERLGSSGGGVVPMSRS